MVHPLEPFEDLDEIDYTVDLNGRLIDEPKVDSIGFYHCDECGKRVLDNEMKLSMTKFGHVLCPNCLDDAVGHRSIVVNSILGGNND